jgi:type I restriction enzyme S subunit
MSHWRTATFSELIAEGPTNGYSGATAPDATGSPTLRLSATTSGALVLDQVTTKRLDETIPEDSALWLRPGDLLVQRSNTIDLVGTAAIYDGPPDAFIYPDLMMRLRLRPDTDSRFICRYLNSPVGRASMRRLASGTSGSMPKISGARLRTLLVPVPPLSEQRRIAEILDKADALRAKRRAALAQLDALTQSIFVDMFGDPATNLKEWPIVTIADICEVRGGKRLPKGEEYSSVPTPFRYIRVLDLKGGNVDESALVYLKPEVQAEIARYTVNAGDVIISIAGSIGLVAAVPQSLDGVNLTENAAKLVPRQPRLYEAEYLATFLGSNHAQSQIHSYVGKVTIGKLALFRIERIAVPLPPIELQREFVRRLAALGSRAAGQRASALRLDDLFASLQYYAFRGEL